MKGERRRLEKITSSLSPQQAALLWMEEAHSFGSQVHYVRWLCEQPDDAYPLIKMPTQVALAIREAAKGRPPAEVNQRVRLAQRDVLFLYFLHKTVNQHALQELPLLRLRASALGDRLRTLFQQEALGRDIGHAILLLGGFELPKGAFRHLKRWQLYDAAKERCRGKLTLPFDREPFGEKVKGWAADLVELRQEVGALEAGITSLASRYLQGTELLYPDTAGSLSLLGQGLLGLWDVSEALREPFNGSNPEYMGDAGAAPAPDVDFFIDMAKAETLEKLGEERAAEELVRGHLRKPSVE